MKLIDRYVYDVTRRLPEKQREDVARELKAEIESMVEDQAQGSKPSKSDVVGVLTELGSPSLLADQYRDRPRFIIGPDYYESYIALLKMLYIIILPLLAFIIWMTEAMTANHTAGSMLLKVGGVVFETSIHIFFWTTLSFVFVEKVAAGQRPDRNWKPEDLPELPPGQEISRGESFFAIAWSVFAVLATLFQVPAIYQLIGPKDVPQFFAPEMWPGWTLGLLCIALLGLVAELVKLLIGGWTRLTVMLIAIVNIVTVAFFVSLLAFVDPIANPEMIKLIGESLGQADIAQSIKVGITIFVAVIAVICIWEVGEATYKYRKGGKQ